jgi:hypothetical protein
MKSIYGLGVAIALGIAGALFNFVYLNNRAAQFEKVLFIGIKPDAVVGRGEKIQESHLQEVVVPRSHVGDINAFADRWEARSAAVIGKNASRTLAGPRLVLRSDVTVEPQEQLALAADEKVMFVRIDPHKCIPALISPGDWVSFLVPNAPRAAEPPAEGADPVEPVPAVDEPSKAATTKDAAIGPFKVLSVGTRLATAKEWRTAKIPQAQEDVLTIRISEKDPREKEQANKLWKLMEAIDPRPVAVRLDRQAAQQVAQP